MDSSMALVPVSEPVAGYTADNVVHGAHGEYIVMKIGGKPLLATPAWNLYVAKLPNGQFGFMKISTGTESNAVLEKEAKILKTLLTLSNEADEGIGDERARYNYAAFMPNLIETLYTRESNPRFVIFMGFHESITTYKSLVPAAVAFKANRCDLQSSVWILSKTLKLLAFCHDYGFTVGAVDMSNLLLETERHGILALDFSRADDNPTEDTCLEEVSAAAVLAWTAAGGTRMAPPPHDPGLMSKADYDRFIALLKQIIDDPKPAGAQQDELYDLNDQIWPKVPVLVGPAGATKRQFHNWVVYPR